MKKRIVKTSNNMYEDKLFSQFREMEIGRFVPRTEFEVLEKRLSKLELKLEMIEERLRKMFF